MAKRKQQLTLSAGCTFSQLCGLWMESIDHQVKPSTYALYRTMVEKHILPDLGGCLVEDFDNEILKQFLWDKQNQELSGNTLRLLVFLLKGIISVGAENGIDTAERLRYFIPKGKKSYTKMFDQENSEKLLHYLENSPKIFDIGLLISICTGIRVGELCGLQWRDVDWAGGTLQINRTVSRIRNPNADTKSERGQEKDGHENRARTIVYIGTPKTGTSIREIPLPDFLLSKLQERRREEDFYILTGTTKCMEPRGVQRKFKTILRKCSIPDINIHALRHAFASKWIQNGFDSKALSEILGHSSIKITMDIYVHSNMQQKKSYINRML